MRISEFEKAAKEIARKSGGVLDIAALDTDNHSSELRAAARNLETKLVRRRGKNVMFMGERDDWF